MKLTDACSYRDNNCTWTLDKVMFSSQRNSSLAISPFGTAANLSPGGPGALLSMSDAASSP